MAGLKPPFCGGLERLKVGALNFIKVFNVKLIEGGGEGGGLFLNAMNEFTFNE